MKMLLVGVVGVLALQVVLVGGYLAVNRQDPIILNPDRGLDENGITMVIYCGEGSDREELDKVPPDGALGPWSRGRTIRGDCDIWYHDGVLGGSGSD